MSKSVFGMAIGTVILTTALMMALRLDTVQAAPAAISSLDSLSDGDMIDSAMDFVYGNERTTVFDSFLGKVEIRTVYTNQQRFLFIAAAVAIVLGLLGVLCCCACCLVAINSSDPPPSPVYIAPANVSYVSDAAIKAPIYPNYATVTT